jgi:hypothetical protein
MTRLNRYPHPLERRIKRLRKAAQPEWTTPWMPKGTLRAPMFLMPAPHTYRQRFMRPKRLRDLDGSEWGPPLRIRGRWLPSKWAFSLYEVRGIGHRPSRSEAQRDRLHRVHTSAGRYDDCPF